MCGGKLTSLGGSRWECPYCLSVYDEESVAKNTKFLQEAFDEAKTEIVCNLRRNLYDAVNDEYISSVKVKDCCVELKKYIHDDFAANFYEIAVGNNVKQLTKHIRKINVDKHYDEIESLIRFLIKSIQHEYLLELNNLVERAYKQRDLVLFEKYSTEISIEAQKVENGVYETKMPRDVFVAYSSKDLDSVSDLVETLEEQGLRCFVSVRNLRHGKGSVENYENLLHEAMDHCKSFVFVSSMNSRNFSCDALTKEIPYIQEKDIENAPAEYKNNYSPMPHSFKKPRVEYRIEESRGYNAADAISNEFFDGYERVYSPSEVAERVAKQLVAMPAKKAQENKATPIVAPVVMPASDGVTKIEPLLKRARIFLEDGEWENAENYCEKALDIDPENAQAYIIKLMLDLSVRTEEELTNCAHPFNDNGNFRKAVRFGDEKTAQTLHGYIKTINDRNDTDRKNKIYHQARQLMSANNEQSYKNAIATFESISGWRDSEDKIEQCKQGIIKLEEDLKDAKYDMARELLVLDNYSCLSTKSLIENVESAQRTFESLLDWRDSKAMLNDCDQLLDELHKKLDAEARKRARKVRLISIFSVSSISVVILVAILLNTVIIPLIRYDKAVDLMNEGEYEHAVEIFDSLDGFLDSDEKYDQCQVQISNAKTYSDAIKLMNDGKYAKAIEVFEALNGFEDSTAKIEECKQLLTKDETYAAALALMNEGKYEEAISAFESLNGYKESAEKIVECTNAIKDEAYANALTLMNTGKYEEAIAAFEALNGYKDSAEKIKECKNTINDFVFELNSDNTGYIVSKYKGTLEKVIIPESYKNLPILGIASDAFRGCDSLTSIKIPDSVTSIGDEAFSWCTSLMSITIGNSVTSIGDDAFSWCASLTSITIPNSVTSIGDDAFYDCDSLTSITIPDSVTSIGDLAFSDCDSLTSITIPNSVTSIGDYAFRSCDSLTSITIPDSVTSIGDYAFWNCSSLTSVTFENPNGWWYSSSSTATGGTSLSSSNLADASKAAKYLTLSYYSYYWFRD